MGPKEEELGESRKSGRKGVTWDKTQNRWTAYIEPPGKREGEKRSQRLRKHFYCGNTSVEAALQAAIDQRVAWEAEFGIDNENISSENNLSAGAGVAQNAAGENIFLPLLIITLPSEPFVIAVMYGFDLKYSIA